MNKSGLLLFAHGARDPRWAEPFEAIAGAIRAEAPDRPVKLAFLEFMTPGLREAGDGFAAAGCTEVEVVPLFLGAGGHVRKDLPLLLASLAAAHPQVQWRLRRAVGENAGVIAAMAEAALHFEPADAAPAEPPPASR